MTLSTRSRLFPLFYFKRLFPAFALACLLLLGSKALWGQCPPPGFPEPGNTCPEAPILCENLDGYCSTINNNNTAQAFPGCPGAWTLNNDEWFAFYAGTTTITIQVTPSNCSQGAIEGLQGGIYRACGPPWEVMDVQCPCTTDPFVLSSNNFVVGAVYWMVLDGCNGSICDYRIDVLEGSTIGMPPADPGAVQGQPANCQGDTGLYRIDLVNAATMYEWTLTPPLAALQANANEVELHWSDTLSGTAELCVTVSNLCFPDAKKSCQTVYLRPPAPALDLGPDQIVCTGDSAVFDAGLGYASYLWQDGSTHSSITAKVPGYYWVEVVDSCGGVQRDTAFFSLSLLADTRFPDTAACPGETVSLSLPGFSQYTWAPAAGLSCTDCPTVAISPDATTQYTLLASDSLGCVLRDTFWVTLLPQPVLEQTLRFCPGSGLVLDGTAYTLPVVLTDTLPAALGCDTIRIRRLEYEPLPQASSLALSCPPGITVTVPSGTTQTTVSYNSPAPGTDCICGGLKLTRTAGPASGANFPVGDTQLCYEAADSCGTTASCCFTVRVELAAPPQDDPCDVKNTACVRFELLAIMENPAGQKTYRLRVTNLCPSPLSYAAFQLPDGVTAKAPANGASYLSPGGRTYQVRNPNYSPVYSIRYTPTSAGIAGGAFDIFEYTLPAQADPDYVHAVARLSSGQLFEAHLNVFNCPVQKTPQRPEERTDRQQPTADKQLRVFPNPATDQIQIDLSPWEGQPVQIQWWNAVGQMLWATDLDAAPPQFRLALENSWTAGVYLVEVVDRERQRYRARVVCRR